MGKVSGVNSPTCARMDQRMLDGKLVNNLFSINTDVQKNWRIIIVRLAVIAIECTVYE